VGHKALAEVENTFLHDNR